MMGFLELERSRRELQTYLDALEEEGRKIQMFLKDLPLCNELVTRTIEGYRQQLLQQGSPARCGGEISSEGPVLEEFLPLKRCAAGTIEREDLSDDEDSRRVRCRRDEEDEQEITQQQTKTDWLLSVQLWSSQPEKETQPSMKPVKPDAKGPCDTQMVENKKSAAAAAPLPTAQSSTEDNARAGDACGRTCFPGNGKEERKDDQNQDLSRKARRCWSSELHNKFIQALEQLGGAHVATPKQIRELMKVDGLTNDEVKSHLQKYRLHTGRPNPPKPAGRNSPIVIVGGAWMPQPPVYPTADSLSQGKPLNVTVSHRPSDMAAGNSDSPTSTSTSSHTITTTTGSPRY